ncbi:MAG: polymer-forming cytoskeletal protein [Ignavibacteriaceae bacterium]|jgi:cytoskeletal protein CcmA (bactofilin family)|nr:polymer-forming cytoskeletal protein [Ignavibacteriaceae bacterium]
MISKKESSSADEVSILSNGVTIDGNITSKSNIRIDGIINGNVNVNGNLTLGDSSYIKGDVNARIVTLSGKIEGTVSCIEKIKLESRSELIGDLITKVLIIEEGAKFNGSSSMSNQKE